MGFISSLPQLVWDRKTLLLLQIFVWLDLSGLESHQLKLQKLDWSRW
uniref:Uncharacterized protein n=1 Tax=Arundo donax TaxID=35708 RepID=A0A0A9EJC2_ARUDO